MRDKRQIQRAHDILTAIILDEVYHGLGDEDRTRCRLACDVLCWILEHDHNQTFAGNLARIEEQLTKRGYILEDMSN
jgi:hypothetical protein